jgi:hypothetical protein
MSRLEQIIVHYKERIAQKKQWVRLYSGEEHKYDRLEKINEINILSEVIKDLKTIK